MMPGMRGVNPRQMQMAMKRMGIETTEMKDVDEVIIRTKDKDIVVLAPQVTVVSMKGQKTYQIAGEGEEVRERGSGGGQSSVPAQSGPSVNQEDVELVAGQANVSEEEARAALIESGGEPAEAIIYLMGKKKK
ncbi:MAG: nascent polypeptide-associated complex protein [Methanobacteriota archaeon]